MIYKMLVRFDILLWNLFVPKMNVDFFKKKFNSLLVILYVSMYKLPRKFLVHYFRGEGKPMIVDSWKLIARNPLVVKKIIDAVQSDIEQKRISGSLNVSQTYVDNPNDRYAIGSFSVNYLLENETITINIVSNYRFQNLPDRITRYLHTWLRTFTIGGKASDFKIIGTDWMTDLNELMSLKSDNFNLQKQRLQVLV